VSSAQLADAVAAVLAAESVGLSCDALATTLRRRRSVVFAALSADPRFVRHGSTCGLRWRLAVTTPQRGYGTELAGLGAVGLTPSYPSGEETAAA
jgi:hypothetical protein